METEKMIRELKRVEEIHKHDKVFTGNLNIAEMARDVRERLEELKPYEDTGLTPEQIMELKERDTAKVPEVFDGHWYKCPTCGEYAGGLKGNFCHVCGQRLKWED
ncbi:hypothetical protein [Mordavella massiliensis]|uniref:Uncharacterized protein n=1 Tax=Mordavella massiliensis TaxID=1871024 RepID=A0A939BHY8_9CLOT|nr:hypothetical protein [Mordavella massiliensis]MBM6949331.1 hypothetical protein [Mordavella massiliensis]